MFVKGNSYRILIVSLATDVKRRAELVQAVEENGYEFDVIEAIDGRQGLGAEHEALVDRKTTERAIARPLSDQEYACALSHRKAYAQIVESGLPGAIILEDDAILSPRFHQFMQSRAYLEAPMILLYHTFARILRGQERPFAGLGRAGRVANLPRGAVAYSVDAATAKSLLEATTPIRRDADWPTDLYPFGALALCPPVVGHPPQTIAQSNLEADRIEMLNRSHKKPFERFFTALYWRTRFSVRFCRERDRA